jgi:hypothetical protein
MKMAYKAPYTQKIRIKIEDNSIREITSIVVDQCDFNEVVDQLIINEIKQTYIDDSTQFIKSSRDHGEAIKTAGVIPLISKGTKTDFIFERFAITTEFAAIIVRDRGPEVLDMLSKSKSGRN